MTQQDFAAAATASAKAAALDLLLPGAPAQQLRARFAAMEAANVREFCDAVMSSDHYRVALARIAMSYDGGQLVEGDAI